MRISEGLTAIVSVKVEEPQFEGQTKQKLGNSEARGAVDNIVSEQLDLLFRTEPHSSKSHVREVHYGSESPCGSSERPEI